ncbi:hypothetical protein JCM10213_002873 [Rhodosporidiobolus nylandii]
MAPKIVVHRAAASQPLLDAFPGGQMLDLSAFPELTGPMTSGVFRNLGTEPEFDVVYPIHELKYVTEGELAVIQDGEKITATTGDLVYIPAGSEFRILPTVFTAI